MGWFSVEQSTVYCDSVFPDGLSGRYYDRSEKSGLLLSDILLYHRASQMSISREMRLCTRKPKAVCIVHFFVSCRAFSM